MKEAVIGVDLGGTKVQAGRVVNSKIEEKYQTSVSANAQDEEIIVKEMFETIEKVITKDVIAIGIGVPSLVDTEKGIVYNVENIPSWKEVHLKEKTEERFGIPVFINNDANCFALGEYYYGKGRGVKHMVGLTIGTGLGSGIIINRKLYEGANCGAGEIGTVPYKDSNIEDYTSGQFFKTKYGKDGKEIYEETLKGDKTALKAFEELGKNLGVAIKIILSLYDPEAIILGGSISSAFNFFKVSMFKELEDFLFPFVIKKLKLEVSENKENPILGAAALYYNNLV